MFGNFLLADEINRAPAKVQSALLEVMQERQVTIGGETHPLPSPFLVLATQNPIESEGTYPLPEAQVDRFLFKLLVDYPTVGEEAAVVGRAIGAAAAGARAARASTDLERYRAAAQRVFVDRDVIGYAVALADATRRPDRYGLHDVAPLIEYGASPRGPIGLIQAAQALALLRGRGARGRRGRRRPRRATCCATGSCSPTTRSATAWRADDVLARILAAVGGVRAGGAGGGGGVSRARRSPPRRRARGPGRCRARWSRRSTSCSRGARPGVLPGERRAAGPRRRAPSSRRSGRTRSATTCAGSTPPPAPAPASRTCATTCPSAR